MGAIDSSRRADMGWDALILSSGLLLFVLLVLAHVGTDGSGYADRIISYATAILVCVGIFWLAVRPYGNRFSGIDLRPRIILARLQADRIARTLARIVLFLMTLSSCVTILLSFRHVGASWNEKFCELIAHGALALGGIYTVVVATASRQRVRSNIGQTE